MIYFSCKKVEILGTKYPSLCRYIAEGTDLWKGVNKKMPIHLKRKNGEVTPYMNSEFTTKLYCGDCGRLMAGESGKGC